MESANWTKGLERIYINNAEVMKQNLLPASLFSRKGYLNPILHFKLIMDLN